MKIVETLIVLAAAAAATALRAGDLGAELVSGRIWSMNAQDFVKAHRGEGFRFLTAARDSVTCQRPGSVKIAGLPAYETRVWFSQPGTRAKNAGCAVRAEVSVYNSGDARAPMYAGELDTVLASLRGAFSSSKPRWDRPVATEKGGSSVHVQSFRSAAADGEIAWGEGGAHGGRRSVNFVRLSLVPPGTPRRNSLNNAAKSAAAVSANRVRRPNGDVLITSVPMVDQGQKGYCAAATAERVLRYYGLTVDEHELAQMAGTTAEGGTSQTDMIAAVEKIGRAWRLGKNEIYRTGAKIEELEKFLAVYNQIARRNGKRQLHLESFARGYAIDGAELQRAYDPETLKAAKMKQSAMYRRFEQGVKAQIDKGVPLFWGVSLGIFPEPDIPQAEGGHMRLIIGYNDKTKEIIYSDTWGAGHEEKRMARDKAWAITTALFYLKPLR